MSILNLSTDKDSSIQSITSFYFLEFFLEFFFFFVFMWLNDTAELCLTVVYHNKGKYKILC